MFVLNVAKNFLLLLQDKEISVTIKEHIKETVHFVVNPVLVNGRKDNNCRDAVIGSQGGLKNRWSKDRVGSSPILGIFFLGVNMKKAMVAFFLVAVMASVFAQDIKTFIVGTWEVQGNLPSSQIVFKENICLVYMRSGEINTFDYSIADGFLFLGTFGYRYELTGNVLVLTPAFGEGGSIVTFIKKE